MMALEKDSYALLAELVEEIKKIERKLGELLLKAERMSDS